MRPSHGLAPGVTLAAVSAAEDRTRSLDLEKGEDQLLTSFNNHDVHSLAWRDLEVVVQSSQTAKKKTLLSGVSGNAQPGQMMALMGPSGSGKTTLLNTLAQRQTATVAGQVLVNGREQSLATHWRLSAFVEQEDTLIGSLTARETLRFAAKLALPRSTTNNKIDSRVQSMIAQFGLERQANTLVGTPFRKGLSGGQKRRVSVASQLITGPRILYLDEPTSGLDSTASFEVMSFIKSIASQYNLIVIASIHQPSTKTFELFDQVLLLSQGKTCYNGDRAKMPAYFADLGMEMPPMTNPAEHMLDLTNADFSDGQAGIERITDSWRTSDTSHELDASLQAVTARPDNDRGAEAFHDSATKPGAVSQTLTLLHRAWIKSYRDIVTYWIRVAMYLGLAIMMGTVWLRLSNDQANIQPFINAIFFGSAFMSFMAVAYVPAFLEDRAIFVKERANGLYGPTAFLMSNFLIGLPYLFLISVLFSIVAYWLANFNATAHSFFMWIMWLFLDLLAAESLVVLVASMIPNFVGALAITAFANGLWMCVGGFLVSLPTLNVFWKYAFHYWDYQAYVFQGMMVNQFSTQNYRCGAVSGPEGCSCLYASALQDKCEIAGEAVLREYGYAVGKQGQWVGIMIAIIVGYRLAAWLAMRIRKT